jgi:hypothetical protein
MDGLTPKMTERGDLLTALHGWPSCAQVDEHRPQGHAYSPE